MTTLVFSSLKMQSDRLSIFEVEFLISQTNVVRLGQAGTAYLLVVFFIQAIPEFIKMFAWIWDARIDSEERRAWNEFSNSWGMDDDGFFEPSDGPEGESREIKHRFDQARKSKATRVEMMSALSLALANFFIAYCSPLVSALLCILWPSALSLLLG